MIAKRDLPTCLTMQELPRGDLSGLPGGQYDVKILSGHQRNLSVSTSGAVIYKMRQCREQILPPGDLSDLSETKISMVRLSIGTF